MSTTTEPTDAPAAVRRTLATVRERDRRHFADRPFRWEEEDSWSYARPAVEGEFWPETVPAGARVLVCGTPAAAVRARRCGAVVAMDSDDAHAETAALLRPPAGATVVKLRRGSMVVRRLVAAGADGRS